MTRRWTPLGAVLSIALGGLVGCSQAPAGDGGQKAEQAILNANPADGDMFQAVGAILPWDLWDVACSGTLVAPKVVVTAKHCTKYIDQGAFMAFGVVADEQLINITGYVAAPDSRNHPGLLLNGGRDVAVVFLEDAPVGIQPAKLGLFTRDMLGKQFQIAGYGISDWGIPGIRFAGPATARALAGQWYNLLFGGDKEAYLEWYWTDAKYAEPSDKQAQDWWRTYRLEPGYELLAGGLPGESLACHGDSGGPIYLGESADDLTVYGVSFAVEDSIATECALGGGYLVFNRTMLEFVQSAIAGQ
jgi:hypothetical protein